MFMADLPIKSWLERDGRLLRIRLAKPKGNIVDIAMIAALEDVLRQQWDNGKLLGLIFDHEGPHFGFGASIPEHLPHKVDELVTKLHAMIKNMLAFPVPVIMLVRGQCVGGSLEVVLAGHLIFASHDAMLGQPEIRLGTMAPVGSCLLPERIGRAQAEDLLLSGRSVTAEEAKRLGLVNEVTEDLEATALNYFDTYLAGHSPNSLRCSVKAMRRAMLARVIPELDLVEAIYLKEMIKHPDPEEGLRAFMEKRKPVWKPL
jgi:cyclohexa-1,5-dienecarbonyl-CoA hydratase